MKILECVPNFSEGRNMAVVDAIAAAIKNIAGVKLIDFSMDYDHHRSVFTFIGSPEDVLQGALAAANKGVELIDMHSHNGVHPRIGAVDVVPFIPIKEMEMKEAVSIAWQFGKIFSETNHVPVFFYGEAALNPDRKHLGVVRRGGYESLEEKISDGSGRPCIGEAAFDSRAGATAVGARIPLIAYNINLKSDNLKIAKDIAGKIRESNGGLKNLMAMGILLKSRGIVQVSMNLTNYMETPLCVVFNRVKEEAAARHVEILESELIGLLPQAAMTNVTAEYLKLKDFSPARLLESYL